VINQAHIAYFNELFQIHEEVSILKPCVLQDGIIQIDETSEKVYTSFFNQRIPDLIIEKFVPASGAATRMFAPLTHVQIENLLPEVELFLLQIEKMPFAQMLESQLKERGHTIKKCIEENNWSLLLSSILNESGLGFLNKPKGLIPFHCYSGGSRTAFEEHLFDFSHFYKNARKSSLHFTVQQKFKEEINTILHDFAKKQSISCSIDFSIQDAETDIPAMDDAGEFHYNPDGTIFLRPAGHGALIRNLNTLEGQCVFIQNIDNISNEEFQEGSRNKRRVMGGLLLHLVEERNRLFHSIQNGDNQEALIEACAFMSTWFQKQSVVDNKAEVLNALNKPIRICGMVKNTGEPGGGPFWVEAGGVISQQIIESAQINKDDVEQKQIFETSTHFNPVDIACHFLDPLGKKYNLEDLANKRATLLSEKLIFGKKSKIIELPGLWNGGMWNWHTVFIELPSSSFCPVKTVNDLLKPGHLATQS